MTTTQRAAIAGLELSEEFATEDGKPIGVLKKIKFADKLVALDKLARHLGMFNDKIKLVGDKDNPLMLLIQRIQGRRSSPFRRRGR